MGIQEDRESIQNPASESWAKRPYAKPVFTIYGNVRGITLAPSPGVYESGRGAGFWEGGLQTGPGSG